MNEAEAVIARAVGHAAGGRRAEGPGSLLQDGGRSCARVVASGDIDVVLGVFAEFGYRLVEAQGRRSE
jgi:hypothetical protein